MASDVVGPATLVVSQGFSAFATFLPKLSDVRKADATLNPDVVGDVRLGEVAAFAFCVGTGVIVSSLTGSPAPTVVAVLMGLALVCVYETALWGNKVMNPKDGMVRANA